MGHSNQKQFYFVDSKEEIPLRFLSEVENLVFGVGSIRGLAFIGALAEILPYWNRSRLRGLAGSSVGAIMCFGLALDLAPSDMRAFVRSGKYHFGWRPQKTLGCSAASRWSFFDTMALKEQLQAIMQSRGYAPDISFAQFRPELDLRIIAHDLTSDQSKVFSSATTPDVHVLDAVLASCSMPFVFPPVKIDGHCFVDGNVDDEFPLLQFPPANTLGFFLFDRYRQQKSATAETFRFAHERKYHVISIDVSDVSFFELQPSAQTQEFLLQQGHEASRRRLF